MQPMVYSFSFFRYMLAISSCMMIWADLPAQHEPPIPGYIISWKGDTTHGQIIPAGDFKNQRQITFVDQNQVQVVYHPDRIAGYGIGDSLRYLSRPTPYLYAGLFAESHVFFKSIIQGPANLYRFYSLRSAFTLKKGPGYFEILEKPDGSWHEVSLIFGWKHAAQVFDEYPALAAKIRNKEFRPEQLEEVVNLYNEWYQTSAKGK